MNRNEQVCLVFVGDGRARFQRDERVVVAGVDHVRAQSRFQQPSQAQRNVEHQVFLQQPIRSDGSGVVSPVSGIDHDAADLQPEGANQAAVAIGRRRGLVDGWIAALGSYLLVAA